MKVGVYSGSFDPITLGHQNIIERASKIFDKLIIVISINSEKNYWFTLEERREMLEGLFKVYKNIYVDSYEGLIVNYLIEKGYNTIVRGIRTVEDCNLELYFADGNLMISENKIDTVFLPAYKEYIHVSSTAAREIARYGGKVTYYVDKKIAKRLLERGKQYNPKKK